MTFITMFNTADVDEKDDTFETCLKNTMESTEPLSYSPNCPLTLSTSVQSLHDGMAMKLGNMQKMDVPEIPTLKAKEEFEEVKYHESPASGKELKCGLCFETFQYVSEFMFHDQIHRATNRFECQLCGRQFQSTSNLKDHYNVHTGERPYKCELCAKAFTQSSSLLTHKRTHTMENPYKCEVCGRLFRDASNFVKHQRLHSQAQQLGRQAHAASQIISEKPYQCSYCEKSFKRTSDLKDHERVHTGERPYQCRICQKCFTQSSVLTGHMRIHTGERPFHCEICGKTFNNSSNFKKHQRTHSVQDMLANVSRDARYSHYKQPLRSKNGIGHSEDINAISYGKEISVNHPRTLPKINLYEEDCKIVLEKNTSQGNGDVIHDLDGLSSPCAGVTDLTKHTDENIPDAKDTGSKVIFHSDEVIAIDDTDDKEDLGAESETKEVGPKINFENLILPKLARSVGPGYKITTPYWANFIKQSSNHKMDLNPQIIGDDLSKTSLQSQDEDLKEARNEDGSTFDLSKDLQVCQPEKQSSGMEEQQESEVISDISSTSDLGESENLFIERTMECWNQSIDGTMGDQDDDDDNDLLFIEMESKPYICFVCSKRFKRATDLKEHLRVHTGERPFVCQVCGKGFTQSSALSSHQRIHTGEKPFQCEICYKRFNNSSNFSKHKRVHTGERPHNCPVCGKSFQEKRRVKRHLKAVHQIQE
ncbi:zinc finger protein 502 [Xenopus laevis]|uniref:Zinc finger protein 502 n=2 Tax=Xenopus laevis TaxID=8355 RepID=A0A1L8FMT5_XENLA|nr:zinc finger protein 502 [Xenopus laevis]OCT72912.1 hypothetical protein XELAEV_18035893mg [Xenopus laevis]